MSKGSPARGWMALGVSAAALMAAYPALALAQAPGPATAASATQAGALPGAHGPASGGLGTQNPQPSANVSAVPAAGAKTLANGPQTGSGTTIEEIVVTAQRREESIQDTPVAVSAFSADSLKAKRLDGADALLLSVPNVNYSRSNFGGNNFQIRGVGSKVISTTADAGVSFNVNALPVQANHLGETDFYDVERVEVLRGPQGTLYGRTATGGAINVITAKPTDREGGSLTAEFGNYGDKKLTGFVNLPVNDFLQVRLAGFTLDRDGFGTNTYNGDDIDGRNLTSFRASATMTFNDRLRVNLMFEDFNEKDNRNRVGKQLCIKDPGPTSIGGVATSSTLQGFFSQGCQSGSPYQNAAYGTLNSQGTLAGIFSALTGLQAGDAFAGHPLQNHNLHDIEALVDPIYEAHERLAMAQVDYDVTDNLHLSAILGYNRDATTTREDYTRTVANVPFNTVPANTSAFPSLITGATGLPLAVSQAIFTGAYAGIFPGGVVNDPQIGTANRSAVYDRDDATEDEKTAELRLSSSFKGPLNFSVGAIFVNATPFSNYYVFFNPLTAFIQGADTLAPGSYGIDPNPGLDANGTGHNYYDSRYGDELNSYAGFGEVYYQLTSDIKLTGGFRYTVDNKKLTAYPSQLFVAGSGLGPVQHDSVVFKEPTGRFNVEWTPHLSFTDQTMVYATYSHGYKPGGFNTPCQNADFSSTNGGCGYPLAYQPELIDAYELGTKNTLLHGSLVLNLTGFYYDYSGYQVSEIVAKSSVNTNINAEIYGAEVESIWEPVHNLTLNANIGYLHTELKDTKLYDQANATNGDPGLTLVKAEDGSNCVVNTQALASYLTQVQTLSPFDQIAAVVGAPGTTSAGVCGGSGPAALYNYGGRDMNTVTLGGAVVGQGENQDLSGRNLPNSPDLTISLGAQYTLALGDDWKATLRGDYYWQDDSYARIFNSVYDKLKSYDQINATLTFDNVRWGFNVQLFVKNLTDSQPFTDFYLTDASSGLFLNSFTLDPRTFGVSLTKRF